MIRFECPYCQKSIRVDDAAAGKKGKCPQCAKLIDIPTPKSQVPASGPPPSGDAVAAVRPSSLENLPVPPVSAVEVTPAPTPVSASMLPTPPLPIPAASVTSPRPSVSARPHSAHKPDGLLAKFANEEQDPKIVEQVYGRVQAIVTTGEEILYIAVQNRPLVNISPDCVVLTNKRFIIYHAKLLGRSDFVDFIWRDLRDCRIKEGLMGATLTMHTAQGHHVSIDYLPKAQARSLYRFAQEMEEKSLEERRSRDLEERRAAAGGIMFQGGFPTPQPASAQTAPAQPTQEDPVHKLTKLKAMLDAGLITTEEYDAKKAEILARM